jgi:DnaJ-class molecular chaperone
MTEPRVPCPKCNGLGSFRETVKDKNDKEKDRFRVCKFCKGLGYILKDRWTPR